jgi:hypothetical protein
MAGMTRTVSNVGEAKPNSSEPAQMSVPAQDGTGEPCGIVFGTMETGE